jgi:hypothetical protein
MADLPPDHAALRAALLAVIDRHDPEGLLAMGAPPDEYEPEAAALARVRGGGTPITAELLVAVWERWFGPGSGFVSRAGQAELATFAAELEAAAAGVR